MEQIEEKEIRPYDVIVIGAGAAGMMAAGTAARDGKRVLLIEKMDKSGRKVRITGKGRCNVTNARPAEEFAAQVRTNAEFLGQAFAEFNNRAAIRFFEKAGVKLDIERGERVFPKSGKAWDIANALLEYCYENGVKIIYNTRVTEIMTLGDKVFGVRYINRRGFERKEECPQVIVATGGVSYPATGSTGDGYTFAADLGHTVEPVRPSLTPLVSSHPQIGYLHGLLLKNIRAVLYVDDEPVREEFGELGFSERGIEGAVALRMSRDAVDALIDERRVKLVVDLKPALTEEVLRERIAREIAGMEPTEFFAELLGAQAARDDFGARTRCQRKELHRQAHRRGDNPPYQDAQGIHVPHHGLCAVRIRHRDGRGRFLRRSQPLYHGIAEDPGALFRGRSARPRCQYGRL